MYTPISSSLQQTGGRGLNSQLSSVCVCIICLFMCTLCALICTRRPVPHTRVFKVAPEVKAYLDRARMISSGVARLSPGICDECKYPYEFGCYQRNAIDRLDEWCNEETWEGYDEETLGRYALLISPILRGWILQDNEKNGPFPHAGLGPRTTPRASSTTGAIAERGALCVAQVLYEEEKRDAEDTSSKYEVRRSSHGCRAVVRNCYACLGLTRLIRLGMYVCMYVYLYLLCVTSIYTIYISISTYTLEAFDGFFLFRTSTIIFCTMKNPWRRGLWQGVPWGSSILVVI